VTLRSARRIATDDSSEHSSEHSSFGFPPLPAYVRGVKIILLCVLAVACSSFAGCASKKSKSRYRNYEGDSNPGIRMLEEKPGYPLNTR
jgi:hypothetical protein